MERGPREWLGFRTIAQAWKKIPHLEWASLTESIF
jgi:hypothetical protein